MWYSVSVRLLGNRYATMGLQCLVVLQYIQHSTYSQQLLHTKPSDSGVPGKSLACLGAELLHVVNSVALL